MAYIDDNAVQFYLQEISPRITFTGNLRAYGDSGMTM